MTDNEHRPEGLVFGTMFMFETGKRLAYGGGQGMIAGWENPCFSTV